MPFRRAQRRFEDEFANRLAEAQIKLFGPGSERGYNGEGEADARESVKTISAPGAPLVTLEAILYVRRIKTFVLRGFVPFRRRAGSGPTL